MELFIIRHGQSLNNVTMKNNQHDREADPSLTELGHQQAEAVAEYLKSGLNLETIVGFPPNDRDIHTGLGITHLFCSAMLRARSRR